MKTTEIKSERFRTVEHQGRAGMVPEAVARVLHRRATGDEFGLMLELAAAQEQNMDFAGARETLLMTPATTAETRADILSAVTFSYAFEGKIEEALATAERIEADFPRAQQIAETMLKVGGTIAKLSPEQRRVTACANRKAQAIQSVIVELNKMQRFDAATAVVARIGLKAFRERALVGIAVAAANSGHIDSAQKCYSQVSDRYRQEQVIPHIASALIRQRRFEEAEKLLPTVENPLERARTAFAMATAYAEMGDDPAVRRVVNVALSSTGSATGFTLNQSKRVVAAFLQGGHVAKAASFAQRMKLSDQLSEAFQGIATAAAQHGRRDQARQMFINSRVVAEEVGTGVSTVCRLCEIAIAQLDAGDQAGAATTVDRATNIVKTALDDPDCRPDECLLDLSRTVAVISGPEAANKTIALIEQHFAGRQGGNELAIFLQRIARTQAQIGRIDDAVAAARNVKSVMTQAYMLVGAVQGIMARQQKIPLVERVDPLRSGG